jgi:LPS O-antigen subunit length determinant protein (WzzB/FepE family)
MKPYNSSTQNNEIDLFKLILTISKKKFLIACISLIFGVAGYIYAANQPKIYQSTIVVLDPQVMMFEKYHNFFSYLKNPSNSQIIVEAYNIEFKIKLSSTDNFFKFIEQNKKIDQLKSYLKNNNVDLQEYFKKKFEFKKENNSHLSLSKYLSYYTLNYEGPLIYQKFLEDYIIFTKGQVDALFDEYIKNIILNEIKDLEINYEIAKKMELENSSLETRKIIELEANYPIYYKGKKVISDYILILKRILAEEKYKKNDFNPILDSSSTMKLIAAPTFYTSAISFFFGFILSLLIVIFRDNYLNMIKKKN